MIFEWSHCNRICITVVWSQEDKKVLFYYPTDVELDTKIRQIGLCEAVIKFTRYVIRVCFMIVCSSLRVKWSHSVLLMFLLLFHGLQQVFVDIDWAVNISRKCFYSDFLKYSLFYGEY